MPIPNTEASTRINFEKIREVPDLIGLVFMNQTYSFPCAVGDPHHQYGTVDTNTTYASRAVFQTSPLHWINQQLARNLQPMAIVLTIEERGNPNPAIVNLNCVDAAPLMIKNTNCAFVVGPYIEEKVYYSTIDDFAAHLRLAAVRWMAKQQNINPTDVVQKYSVTPNRGDIDSYQLGILPISTPTSDKAVNVTHRVFNVHISANS